MRDALFRDYVTYLKVDYKIKCWILTHHIFSSLYRKAANYGPWIDQILPPFGFVSKVLLEPGPLICLQVAASHYSSERPAKPICLLSVPLQKKCANPSLSRFRGGFPFLGPAMTLKSHSVTTGPSQCALHLLRSPAWINNCLFSWGWEWPQSQIWKVFL